MLRHSARDRDRFGRFIADSARVRSAPSSLPSAYASDADQTLALLNESVTAQKTERSGPAARRNDPAIDISAKGLLPQLIDVLAALTEAQKLLSGQVRNVRHAYSEDVSPVVEGRH
jgi:hypothetical protein